MLLIETLRFQMLVIVVYHPKSGLSYVFKRHRYAIVRPSLSIIQIREVMEEGYLNDNEQRDAKRNKNRKKCHRHQPYQHNKHVSISGSQSHQP